MPKQIFGAESVVTTLNRAFNDVSPSNATFNNQVTAAGTTAESQMAFAKQYGAGYAGLTADALSTLILNNLGLLPNTALQTGLKDYITAAGISNVGIIALQLGDILAGLENATGDQAAFKAAATAWNAEVTAAYNYSSNPLNVTPSGTGTPTSPGATFVLSTTGGTVEVFGPNQGETKYKSTSGDDTFIAANGALEAANTEVIDGGAGNDTLKVTHTAATTLAPTLTSIEKILFTGSTASAVLDLAGNADVKEAWVSESTIAESTTVSFSNVKLGTTVGLVNVKAADTDVGATNTATSTVAFAFKGATGGSDAATVLLNGATAVDPALVNGDTLTLSVNEIENLTLSTVTAASKINLSAADAKTLTITGDKNLSIDAFSTAALTSIDASAAKGVVTLGALTAIATEMSITLGQGADVVALGGSKQTLVYNNTNLSKLAAADTVTGFASTTDKIDLKAFGLSSLKIDGVAAVTTNPAGEFADFFKSGGNSFAVAFNNTVGAQAIYVDVNKDGNFNTATDLVIKVTGTTAIVAGDFIFS